MPPAHIDRLAPGLLHVAVDDDPDGGSGGAGVHHDAGIDVEQLSDG